MTRKTLYVGISSHEALKARTLAIARGEYKPKKGEPKVWFTSIESFSKILSQRNQELLRLIAQERPKSLTELATLSGRKKPNLSRTLHTMERYGLVELTMGKQGTIVPRTVYNHIKLDLDLMQLA